MEMNRLELHFYKITAYWKVEKKGSDILMKIIKNQSMTYTLDIIYCVYIIRAKWPERETP